MASYRMNKGHKFTFLLRPSRYLVIRLGIYKVRNVGCYFGIEIADGLDCYCEFMYLNLDWEDTIIKESIIL